MKLLKDITRLWNNDWLLDNVRSNLLNIIIGLDISLLVNLFTGSSKNSQIWLAIVCYSISVVFLLMTLLRRDKLEKDLKLDIKSNPSIHISKVLDNFFKKKEIEFREFKLFLSAFIITILFGILLTYWGNKIIASEENQKATQYSASLVKTKSSLKDLILKADSLEILVHQSIESSTLNKTKQISGKNIHGR